MSIDIKDHRKFVDGKLKEAMEKEEAKPVVLLEQRTVANETGEPHLDKLMRALAAQIEKDDAHSVDVAIKGMGNVNPDALRLHQNEYFYTKGKLDGLMFAMKLPEQIIMEEKGSTTH